MSAQPPRSEGDGVEIEFAVAPVYQFETDLDSGADFSATRTSFRFDASTSLGGPFDIKLGLAYDLTDYHFSGSAFSLAGDPWDNIHTLGLSVPIIYKLRRDWKLFVAPSFEYARESDADWSDSFTYGGAVSASHFVSRTFMIGFGAGVFRKIGTTAVFPFLMIYWKINERLTLSNPLRVGPAGPAGLALSYTINDDWEAGIGGAYRSYRFRLDDRGVAPNGIGEDEFAPLWGRLSRKLGKRSELSLYAGALLAGKLKINNEDGGELGVDRYNSAAFVAATISGKF